MFIKFPVDRYFKHILYALASAPFYTLNVRLPTVNDPVPDFIRNNPKLFPFFEGALGAIDGTHINCAPSAAERHAARDRKGGITQNTLAACTWLMRFVYVVSGWEGACADAEMLEVSRYIDFPVPAGKYYLGDAGFGACNALLVPFRGVRYHLQEWGRAGVRYVAVFFNFNIETNLM